MSHQGQSIERRLAAIVAADVAGYSRLMGEDEAGTLARLSAHRSILDNRIARYRGRIANTAGDSVLAEFPSAVDALRSVIAAQEELAAANAALPERERLEFRIGLHVGDVMVSGGDLFGDGVNIAARLQAIAEPGGICLSGTAHEQVRKTVPVEYVDLGAQQAKNIAEKVPAFAVRSARGSAPLPRAPLPLPDKPSLAVLPFANMSGDAEQEYFSDGMTEDIITALSRVRWFFVIARNSSFAYKGKAVDVRQIGRELGVRYVVEGSVRKSGNRLRIVVQLIEAENGRHVWADKFDGVMENVFELQDRVAESVVGAIEPSLQLAEIQRSQEKPTSNLSAYDLVLRALPNTQVDTPRPLSDQAIQLLERAIAIDPSYAQAIGLLTLCYSLRKGNEWATSDEIRRGLTLAQDATRLIVDDPIAMSNIGLTISFLPGGNPAEGLSLTERAYAMNPNLSRVIMNSGAANLYNARPEIAIERLGRALRISPIDPGTKLVHGLAGLAYSVLGRNDDALAAGLRALSETPLWASGRRVLIASLANLGRLAEARSEVARLQALQPEINIRSIVDSAMGRADKALGGLYVRGLRAAGYPE